MKEFSFDLTVDRNHLHDTVEGLICTVFFYRSFGTVLPQLRELLDVPYPFVESPELEELIENKINTLIAKIDSDSDTPVFSATPMGSPPAFKHINAVSSSAPINTNPYSNIRFNDDDEIDNITSSPTTTTTTTTTSANTTLDQGGSIHSLLNPRSPSLRPNPAQPTNVKFTQVSIKFYEVRKLKKPTWFGKVEEEIPFEEWLINIRVIKTPYQGKQELNSLVKQFEKLIWDISEVANSNKDHIPLITSTDLLPFSNSISIKSTGNGESWKSFIKRMIKEPIY